MPNSACPGAARSAKATRARSAQRSDSSIARSASLRSAGSSMHSSSCIWMSDAEQALDLHRALGRQHVARAVDVRGKAHALLAHLADLRQRHDLEAARVGEDRPFPAHEGVQAAEPRHALRAGAQHQVVGVGEDDVGARLFHLVEVERLDRAGSADRHEGRRAHDAARRRQRAEARRAVLALHLKSKRRHAFLHRVFEDLET